MGVGAEGAVGDGQDGLAEAGVVGCPSGERPPRRVLDLMGSCQVEGVGLSVGVQAVRGDFLVLGVNGVPASTHRRFDPDRTTPGRADPKCEQQGNRQQRLSVTPHRPRRHLRLITRLHQRISERQADVPHALPAARTLVDGPR